MITTLRIADSPRLAGLAVLDEELDTQDDQPQTAGQERHDDVKCNLHVSHPLPRLRRCMAMTRCALSIFTGSVPTSLLNNSWSISRSSSRL